MGLLDLQAALPFIVDEIPLGIAVMDSERRVVLLNRAMEALTGFDRETAKTIACRHIVRGDVCLGKCPALSMSHGPGTMCVEGNIVNRERQKIPVRITFTPIKDSRGNVIGFFETVEDIRMLCALAGKSDGAYTFGQVVGRSPEMQQIYRFLPMIAQSDSSVLLTGETGTGKDLVAEAIHQGSPRAKAPFIKVNCGALPATLLESELFGHQKGAFTGAVENKPGRFRLAHNGTLFLTEIGDLPLPLQVKLLTFLDDRIIYPLGSTKGFLCDVRVIAATHRDLERMVKEGTFREDLLFRLNVVRMQLPPLRERGDDVQLLLEHFLQTFISSFKKPIKGFTSNALAILLAYSYPGNVRELKNIVEYASNVCQEDQIQPQHLPAYLANPIPVHEAKDDATRVAPMSSAAQPEEDQDAVDRAAMERRIILDAILKTRERSDEKMEWPAIERKMIVDAIVKAQGRRNKAAAILGWSRSRLYRKILQYGIET
ncbi:MAG TPA: sigma-54-dependent Fis family transcriptional regulator [Syntrophobacteraceae bacterium]|nr:sigma-54-dependent Fis family transcriptional regulator [Syntrophobacteraceae bacterium]